MDSLIVKVFTFLQLIMILTHQSNADSGLASLAGNLLKGNIMSQPGSLIKAAAFANDASKFLPIRTDHPAFVESMKTIESFNPIVLPTSATSTSDGQACDGQIRLDKPSLQLHLTSDKKARLIQKAGLDSKTFDWQLYKCPLTVNQLKKIFASQSSSSSPSSKLSIMALDSYITKVMNNIEGLQDPNFQAMEKCFKSEINMDEFVEHVAELDSTDEGLIIMRGVELKSGALLHKPTGSICLIGMGKVSHGRKKLDPPEIMPIIVIGQLKTDSSSQYETESIEEERPVSSTLIPETVVMETPKTDQVSTVIEVNETPLAQNNPPAPAILSSNQPAPASAQSFFNPPSSQFSSINYQPPPHIPQQAQRPMQRPPPPQQKSNMRPPSFDSRPQHIQQFQPQLLSRPFSRVNGR